MKEKYFQCPKCGYRVTMGTYINIKLDEPCFGKSLSMCEGMTFLDYEEKLGKFTEEYD